MLFLYNIVGCAYLLELTRPGDYNRCTQHMNLLKTDVINVKITPIKGFLENLFEYENVLVISLAFNYSFHSFCFSGLHVNI